MMQSTFYKTLENREALRDECTLRHHTHFAEQVLGMPRAPEKLAGEQFYENLVRETQGRLCTTWFAWCVELLLIALVVMMMATELYGACPVEWGLLPTCRYCYSDTLLTWFGIFATLWFVNVFFFVLLVSKGFALYTERGVWVDNEDKGIQRNHITLYLFLTAALTVWWLVGINNYFESAWRCVPTLPSFRPIWAQDDLGRSYLMVNGLFFTLVVAPFFFVLGRLHFR